MDFSKLTNFQLYAIIKNDDLEVDIRDLANAELEGRNLSFYDMEQIIQKYNLLNVEKNIELVKEEKSLKPEYKVLLLAIPFVMNFFLFAYFMSELQKKGRDTQRKEFMFYYCGGLILWTVILILLAKFYLFKASV